jgi:ribosomal large subunit pseudouridine synthase D (EC 5.4.99.-)
VRCKGLVAEGHVLCNGRSIAKSLKLKAGDTILLEILTQSLSRLCRRTSRWTSCMRTIIFWW